MATAQAAEGAGKLRNAANAVEDYLGVIRNADDDTVLIRRDKKIRSDIRNPHVAKPHFHLEQQTPGGRWKEAEPDHRYYFTE